MAVSDSNFPGGLTVAGGPWAALSVRGGSCAVNNNASGSINIAVP
jgi:hypothetical protein